MFTLVDLHEQCIRNSLRLREQLESEQSWLRPYEWSTRNPNSFCFRIWFQPNLGISISYPYIEQIETALVVGSESSFELFYREDLGYEDVQRFENGEELVHHLRDLFHSDLWSESNLP